MESFRVRAMRARREKDHHLRNLLASRKVETDFQSIFHVHMRLRPSGVSRLQLSMFLI